MEKHLRNIFTLFKNKNIVYVEIDSSPEYSISSLFQDVTNKITVKENITPESIQFIKEKYFFPEKIHLLYINTGYNNYHNVKALLQSVKPSIVISHFNNTICFNENRVSVYSSDYSLDGTEYYSASGNAYEKLLNNQGYEMKNFNDTGIFVAKRKNVKYAPREKDNKHCNEKQPYTNWRGDFDFILNRNFITSDEYSKINYYTITELYKYIKSTIKTDRTIDKKINEIMLSNNKLDWETSDRLIKQLHSFLIIKASGEIINIVEKYPILFSTLCTNALLSVLSDTSELNTLLYITGTNYNQYFYSNNFKFRVFNTKRITTKRIIRNNVSEFNTFVILNSYLADKKEVVVEIGGGIGTFCIPLSEKAEKIYVYEPIEKLYNLLQYNIDKNRIDNIVLSNKVFGSKKEKSSYLDLFSENKGTLNKSKVYDVSTFDTEDIKNFGVLKINSRRNLKGIIDGSKKMILKNKPILVIDNIYNQVNIDTIVEEFKYEKVINVYMDVYVFIPSKKKIRVKDKLLQLEVDKNNKKYKLYTFIR